MRERIKDKTRLEHINHALEVIDILRKDKTFEECESDVATYYALIKNLEIIGEAVYKLTKEFRENHPLTPWNQIEKLRHVIVHDYYNIDFKIIWDTIETDLIDLREQILTYIEEEKQ